uniref:Uncharacterized protein n=1 Tax=Ignisphaera aggregans TaxID=334771 RepID=A0A7C5YZ62_9CREN
MRRNIVIALAISLAIAVSWPLTTYLIYSILPEDVEAIIGVSDVAFPERPPSFLIGVGGLVTFRGTGFKFKGVLISTCEHIGTFKLESGEIIVTLFMPRYRCVGEEYELRGYELAKLIANENAMLKGHIFLTRRGIVFIPIEVAVENKTCIAILPHHR